MRDDEDDGDRHTVPTVPPPPGESDVYEAKTQVGGLSDEALAMLRQLRDEKPVDGSHEEAFVPVFVEEAPFSEPRVRPAAGVPAEVRQRPAAGSPAEPKMPEAATPKAAPVGTGGVAPAALAVPGTSSPVTPAAAPAPLGVRTVPLPFAPGRVPAPADVPAAPVALEAPSSARVASAQEAPFAVPKAPRAPSDVLPVVSPDLEPLSYLPVFGSAPEGGVAPTTGETPARRSPILAIVAGSVILALLLVALAQLALSRIRPPGASPSTSEAPQ